MTMRKTIILTIACMCLAVGANAQRGSYSPRACKDVPYGLS